MSFETQYQKLLKKTLDEGVDNIDRTKVGTRSLFVETMKFDLRQGFPIYTLKKVFWKTAFKEMLLFLEKPN